MRVYTLLLGSLEHGQASQGHVRYICVVVVTLR